MKLKHIESLEERTENFIILGKHVFFGHGGVVQRMVLYMCNDPYRKKNEQ